MKGAPRVNNGATIYFSSFCHGKLVEAPGYMLQHGRYLLPGPSICGFYMYTLTHTTVIQFTVTKEQNLSCIMPHRYYLYTPRHVCIRFFFLPCETDTHTYTLPERTHINCETKHACEILPCSVTICWAENMFLCSV